MNRAAKESGFKIWIGELKTVKSGELEACDCPTERTLRNEEREERRTTREDALERRESREYGRYEYGRNYYDEDDLGSDEDDLGSDEDEEAEVSEDEDEDADCECPYVFDDEDDTTKELSIDRIFAEDGELSHQTR